MENAIVMNNVPVNQTATVKANIKRLSSRGVLDYQAYNLRVDGKLSDNINGLTSVERVSLLDSKLAAILASNKVQAQQTTAIASIINTEKQVLVNKNNGKYDKVNHANVMFKKFAPFVKRYINATENVRKETDAKKLEVKVRQFLNAWCKLDDNKTELEEIAKLKASGSVKKFGRYSIANVNGASNPRTLCNILDAYKTFKNGDKPKTSNNKKQELTVEQHFKSKVKSALKFGIANIKHSDVQDLNTKLSKIFVDTYKELIVETSNKEHYNKK